MDNPNLIVACIVGDGEAETGPTATLVLGPRLTTVPKTPLKPIN